MPYTAETDSNGDFLKITISYSTVWCQFSCEDHHQIPANRNSQLPVRVAQLHVCNEKPSLIRSSFTRRSHWEVLTASLKSKSYISVVLYFFIAFFSQIRLLNLISRYVPLNRCNKMNESRVVLRLIGTPFADFSGAK